MATGLPFFEPCPVCFFGGVIAPGGGWGGTVDQPLGAGDEDRDVGVAGVPAGRLLGTGVGRKGFGRKASGWMLHTGRREKNVNTCIIHYISFNFQLDKEADSFSREIC